MEQRAAFSPFCVRKCRTFLFVPPPSWFLLPYFRALSSTSRAFPRNIRFCNPEISSSENERLRRAMERFSTRERQQHARVHGTPHAVTRAWARNITLHLHRRVNCSWTASSLERLRVEESSCLRALRVISHFSEIFICWGDKCDFKWWSASRFRTNIGEAQERRKFPVWKFNVKGMA